MEELQKKENIDVLSSEIEIVEEMPPSLEEEKEVQKEKSRNIMQENSWLEKVKTRLENTISDLKKEEASIQENIQGLKAKYEQDVKRMGEVVTKKVSAIEVYNQITMTQKILIALLIAFIFASMSMNQIGLIIGSIVFLGAWGYHFVMNKRKQNYLNNKYQISVVK